MCRTLYVAKTVGIGYTTSMDAREIRVPSRGMRQTDVHMEKERASKYDIQNRNGCIAYWCGGVAYRCISVLVRNYVDVRGAK